MLLYVQRPIPLTGLIRSLCKLQRDLAHQIRAPVQGEWEQSCRRALGCWEEIGLPRQTRPMVSSMVIRPHVVRIVWTTVVRIERTHRSIRSGPLWSVSNSSSGIAVSAGRVSGAASLIVRVRTRCEPSRRQPCSIFMIPSLSYEAISRLTVFSLHPPQRAASCASLVLMEPDLQLKMILNDAIVRKLPPAL